MELLNVVYVYVCETYEFYLKICATLSVFFICFAILLMYRIEMSIRKQIYANDFNNFWF